MSAEIPNPTSENPDVQGVNDPSVLGGNVTSPFNEEVYKQKVQLLEGVLQVQTNENLITQGNTLINAVGGHREAERTDFWESIKSQQAQRSSREVGDILSADVKAWSKPDDQKDMFDKIVTSVAIDHRGTTDPERLQTGRDTVDFNVGFELDALVDTEELQDPTVLAKATQTIRLLVAEGIYKLHKWGNSAQLKTALGLIETYAEYVPDFNPKEAGFAEAREDLTMSLAALQVDQSSKPNYKYAKPERSHLFGDLSAGLAQLRTTEAHMFLRYQDFELPSNTPNGETAQKHQ